MTTNYGNIARSNGLLFEELIVNYYNNEKQKIVPYIKNLYNDDENIILMGSLVRCPQNKVDSIHSVKTTRKSDIWYIYLDKYISFSVKMSNKGTQLQIISIEILSKYFRYYNIIIDTNIICIFKKFLGIDQDRCWMTDMTTDDQLYITNFLNLHKELLYKLIFVMGFVKIQ